MCKAVFIQIIDRGIRISEVFQNEMYIAVSGRFFDGEISDSVSGHLTNLSPTVEIRHLTWKLISNVKIKRPKQASKLFGVKVVYRNTAKEEKGQFQVERMKSKFLAVLFCVTILLLITNSEGIGGRRKPPQSRRSILWKASV